MAQLFMLTVPELEVKSDWATVHDRLLDDFPQVADVLATTMAGTLLIVYEGDADADAWLDGIGEAILIRRLRAAQPRMEMPSPMARPRTTVPERAENAAPVMRSYVSARRHRPGAYLAARIH
jgi:hypothetical protein